MNQKALLISNQTRQKVEAAKIFIQQRYSKLIHQEQQKRDYWDQLNQKMKTMNLSSVQKDQIKRNILHKEAENLRQERTKLSILDFESVKIIGKGAFGEVRLCKWRKNNEPVAVKKLKKSQMIYKNKVIQVREQRNVLANCEKNRWIVGLRCSFQDPDNLYLVMDYVPGGDLMNLLIKKDIFTHDEARFYTAEMILAINSVHQLGYIHRDIKPDNILIEEKGHIKLSDFGLCKHTEMRPKKLLQSIRKTATSKQKITNPIKGNGQSSKQLRHKRRKLAYTAVGTPDYVAPEVQGKSGYTETVDWWSLGVIFYEMLVGYPPFASQQSSITWQKIQNWRKFLVIPKDVYVSPEAGDLIRKLINDPDQRLGSNGVQQIMAHPFFKGVNWNKIRESKAPNIPQLKNPFDTCNFDPFEQQEPWIPVVSKNKLKSKKGTEFIGYTFKPEQESSSELLKALLDLDNYKQPQQYHRSNIESLYLEPSYSSQLQNTNYLFKKERNNGQKKDFFATSSTLMSPKYSVIGTKNPINAWEQNPQKVSSPSSRNLQGPSTQNTQFGYSNNSQMSSGKKIQKKPLSPALREQKRPMTTTANNNIGTKPQVKVIQKKPLQFRK